MYVVINADDLGLHPAVQRAVDELGRRGVLTSASLLVNGPLAEQAARTTSVALGVHLNILRGRPVLPAGRLGTLVDTAGNFLGDYWRLARRAAAGRLDLRQVEDEWEAQLRRALDLGVQPDHLDSEKHIHCWPALMPIVCRLARRYNIAWVRRTVERGWPIGSAGGLLRVLLLRWWAGRHRPADAVRWPDAVWGIACQGRRLSARRLGAYLRRLESAQVVEVVCHPGDPRADDPPLPDAYGRMRVARQWRAEYETLAGGGWREVLQEAGASLVSYRDVP